MGECRFIKIKTFCGDGSLLMKIQHSFGTQPSKLSIAGRQVSDSWQSPCLTHQQLAYWVEGELGTVELMSQDSQGFRQFISLPSRISFLNDLNEPFWLFQTNLSSLFFKIFQKISNCLVSIANQNKTTFWNSEILHERAFPYLHSCTNSNDFSLPCFKPALLNHSSNGEHDAPFQITSINPKQYIQFTAPCCSMCIAQKAQSLKYNSIWRIWKWGENRWAEGEKKWE